MFEKEAEEYADWFWGASPSAQRAIKQAYQQGAEFGYKALCRSRAHSRIKKISRKLYFLSRHPFAGLFDFKAKIKEQILKNR